MEHLKVYIFKSENLAKEAIDKINSRFGIPSTPTATTQTYCNYIAAENGTYIIHFLDELLPILGEPQTIEYKPLKYKP